MKTKGSQKLCATPATTFRAVWAEDWENYVSQTWKRYTIKICKLWYVDWSNNLEGLKTNNAWKKPRLRKVLLLCAIWGKVCTLLTFSASWDEWYLSQTTLLNRTLKRTKMPALSWYRTLSASFLICTYFVPHSQGGSTKLMENVSAIVIKRLLITWAIITTITCVRVKKRWHKNKNHWFCRSNDKTILMNIE